MKLLYSHERFRDVAKYDEESGGFEVVERNYPHQPENLDGNFSILSGIFVAIFKDGLKIFVVIGDETFQLDDDLIITVKGDESDRLLIVEKGNAVLETVKYSISSKSKIAGDMTPFIDDEDFDFGLFLSNISKNKDRQRVLLGLD